MIRSGSWPDEILFCKIGCRLQEEWLARLVIQKGQGEASFKNNGGKLLPANNATERACGALV
jgi:hypothetical protein